MFRDLFAAAFLIVLLPVLAPADVARGRKGVVATVNPLATEAGIQSMRNGGNAVDAAVAAAFMLGVVDAHNSGIGGGCFILIRTADGNLIAIDGRETAPAKSTRDIYLRDGKPQPHLSKTGPLASGVPGSVAAYALAVKRFGRRELSDLVLPAAVIAERGFAIDQVYAARLAATADDLRRFESSRKALLKPNGEAFKKGDVVKRPSLAKTYRQIAERGPDWFYNGPFAATVEEWMAAHGGIMTAKDFAAYRPILREPVVSTYRDLTVVGFPPPSSGGVHVAQILNILEGFDLKAIYDKDRAQFLHIVAEAMKLAFADRAHWLGDGDFVKVPRGLIHKSYAEKLRAKIDIARASKVAGHGSPPRADSDVFGKHTTHIAAADSDGNWVAITATVNTSFGSKVVIPGSGVVMNNQMDDFSIAPGVPNAFGLIGAEANAIEPGKRPLSSMSPTIILKNGKPVMTAGAAGGPRIINEVLLAIINHFDLGMDLHDAVGTPRVHHQWAPDILFVERKTPKQIIKQLKSLGHDAKEMPYMGVTQAVGVSDDGESLIGVADPRVPGKAAGY